MSFGHPFFGSPIEDNLNFSRQFPFGTTYLLHSSFSPQQLFEDRDIRQKLPPYDRTYIWLEFDFTFSWSVPPTSLVNWTNQNLMHFLLRVPSEVNSMNTHFSMPKRRNVQWAYECYMCVFCIVMVSMLRSWRVYKKRNKVNQSMVKMRELVAVLHRVHA